MTMKTLFERLKPEIKETLLKEQTKYPTLVGDLIKTLQDNVAVTEMKLGDLSSVSNFAPGYVNQITQLYDMFEE